MEHDPGEIWGTQFAVAMEAMARADIQAADVAAIGITNQRETTVVWDRATGAPIANAIVWQDRRTAAACDGLRARGLEPRIAQKTGLVLDAYFSATKLAWLLDNVPGARARAAAGALAFGTVDSWLVWKLSGGAAHVTDPSNASRTLLYDIHRRQWDEELLELFDIPAALLPQVCASSGVAARTTDGLLPARIPIAGMAGDQQAALFGQRCNRPGMVKNTYGTGCFMLMHTGGAPVPSRNKLLTTVACSAGAREYALEGSVFIAGAVVQWLRDGLGIIKSSADIERLAGSVPDNGGVYLVPAFAGLGSPHWDAYARGAILGLTRGATAGHLARAALESIAYQSADVLEAMESDSGIRLQELRVDGGAAAQRRPDAVPVRRARRARGAPARARDHRAGGCVSRGSERGLLGKRRSARRAMAGRAGVRAPHEQGRSGRIARRVAQRRRPLAKLGETGVRVDVCCRAEVLMAVRAYSSARKPSR